MTAAAASTASAAAASASFGGASEAAFSFKHLSYLAASAFGTLNIIPV